jgi:hypothetical protein
MARLDSTNLQDGGFMSNSRLLSLRIAGCLLAILLIRVPMAGAQSLGAGGPLFPPAHIPTNATRPGRKALTNYLPGHQRATSSAATVAHDSPVLGEMHSTAMVDEGLAPIPMQGEAMLGGPVGPGDYYGGGGCADGACGGDACSCGVDGCGGCYGGLWGILCNIDRRKEFYSGVSAFSSPVNRGGTGSFGFEGGLNVGSPLFGGWRGLGWQAGAGGTLSSFNGAEFTEDTRNQLFLTAGIFRRVDWGLQWGFVVDYLHEDWYATAELSQVRGEVAWVVPEGLEYGFMFAAGEEDPEVVTGLLQNGTAIPEEFTESWRVNDLYAFYFRRTFCNNAQGRLFAGWSGDSDGLLGADVSIPLDDNWALRSGFTYLIPEEGPLDGGNEEEAWNVSLQLVWYPHCGAMTKDYYRPLFNVANNGSMIIDR